MFEDKNVKAFNEVYQLFMEANKRQMCTQKLLPALPCTDEQRKAINFALTLFSRTVDKMIQINDAEGVPAQTKLQEAAKLCNIMLGMEKCKESKDHMQTIYHDLDLCRIKLLEVGIVVNV